MSDLKTLKKQKKRIRRKGYEKQRGPSTLRKQGFRHDKSRYIMRFIYLSFDSGKSQENYFITSMKLAIMQVILPFLVEIGRQCYV